MIEVIYTCDVCGKEFADTHQEYWMQTITGGLVPNVISKYYLG